MYALFHNGRQVSKTHKHKECVFIEALERKAYYNAFRFGIKLSREYEIKQIKE